MMIFGIAILVFGLAFLLRNLGLLHFPGSFWSLFYPLVIVVVGLVVIFVTHEGRKLLKRLKKFFSGEDDRV
ncbi:MAG: hypothetical protein A3B91_02100 [Candidatus Yanofskybacteria bacterium RIFCSPHIGHO2_02_FULL_41_29]|uniref:LiaI-LiaF-like transmembrane region domain-containing protein n=1 Tax=Candidatus Yanofskybacteria bacterium RIFCSPHIGHO2_01_FULL_41_53 TaxID=1802663 RepID=A0A1F8EG44_9BACT|nr:MAG: hypothetical protein A2650_05025 [Candidatus Yanofskybacteria bacterium RIFCSPHIGHO2_01_FULL_41_53]OGN12319.1 MAG: hypothetical protein A3B91_02100 [Candidatus Yanofskybacteria bacterium RIFCSPHIGHO2_02_FULL_41_29]OGN17722.1 MAG: hypothetical protein A3F48_00595 [Candidatus Yanofskybacteria bacterium RIFCSPHIGHO2_12_FULL_41_9]OGN22028.1 MAG: hypothetical protein A2916_04365 [Candidatus Yanofskybacteria bacterium RIFCSPLOWO2_01_FULL_41_67]OGN28918.1 MAG: hypothetical protein A3H54_02125 